VPGDDGGQSAPRGVGEPPRRRGHDLDAEISGGLLRLALRVGHEEPDLPGGSARQRAGELEGADAHAGHAGTDGLGGQNRDQRRPRSLSRNRCSFQVRDT
jgi:hypothetical protein